MSPKLLLLASGLFCATLLAQEDTLYNTDMYASPAGREKPSKGRFLVYHEGVGKPGQGYFQKHEPGEVAEFHLFVPDGLDSKRRYPLVIVYHGGKDGGSGKGLCRSMSRLSTKQNPVLVLSPNMYTVDSYNELMAEGKFPIDPNRVVVFGFSSGGGGVLAAFQEFLRTRGAFRPATIVSASTTASMGRVRYPQVPYVVMAGEKETPEYAKHPLLKERRSVCRRHSLVMQQVIREVRYIEMQGQGHGSGKPPHLAVLLNLIRALPAPRLALRVGKVRPELETLLRHARFGEWEPLSEEMDRLAEVEEGPVARAYVALRRKILDALLRWFSKEVKTIASRSEKSTSLEITQSLAMYDQLQAVAELFGETPKGEDLKKSFATLERSKHWPAELEARDRYYKIVDERPSEETRGQLEELRKALPKTEFGKNRTKEKLLALQG